MLILLGIYMINAGSLALIITLGIFLYFYSFIHNSSYQRSLMPSVSSLRSGTTSGSKFSDKEGSAKQNPFLLLFDLALWTKLRLIYYVNN